MNNADREIEKRNREKEYIERTLYEIPYEREIESKDLQIENEELIVKIANLIIKTGMNYREANRALYHTDRVLRDRAMRTKL